MKFNNNNNNNNNNKNKLVPSNFKTVAVTWILRFEHSNPAYHLATLSGKQDVIYDCEPMYVCMYVCVCVWVYVCVRARAVH